jgi:hypothetical protein
VELASNENARSAAVSWLYGRPDGPGRAELRPERSIKWLVLAAFECVGSIDDIIVNVWNRTQWARINERWDPLLKA